MRLSYEQMNYSRTRNRGVLLRGAEGFNASLKRDLTDEFEVVYAGLSVRLFSFDSQDDR